MTDHACCITGHREIPPGSEAWLEARLGEELDRAVAEGYTRFLTGFAQGVDQLFARLVVTRRQTNPDLLLQAVLSHQGRMQSMAQAERILLACCNRITVLRREYRQGCYLERNRFLVDNSSLVVAVHDGRQRGGTFYTMNYAEKKGRQLRIIPLE